MPGRTSSARSVPSDSLSVVIPVFNGQGWIGDCITRVGRAVDVAGLGRVELIVVDDGSVDATVVEAEAATWPHSPPIRMISQHNQGRLAARMTGLREATGDIVLFIDTRVHLDEGSLAHVWPLLADPSTRVWTAHTVANTDLSPLAGFWQAIEHVAWRRYWRSPRQLTFGLDEFDFLPKGTTALLAPRAVLVEAFSQYEPTVDDLRISNDDTAVLRWVAEHHGISISPEYSCVYNSRTTVRAFLHHARHRGSVLIDGYMRPGARFANAIVAVLALSPIGFMLAVRYWRWILPATAALSVGTATAARALGARTRDSAVLGVLAVPFGLMYLSGMWRGFAARVRSRH
ncbi:MAG: glycosyltransferase [Ilumatobacteraceae bacterium]